MFNSFDAFGGLFRRHPLAVPNKANRKPGAALVAKMPDLNLGADILSSPTFSPASILFGSGGGFPASYFGKAGDIIIPPIVNDATYERTTTLLAVGDTSQLTLSPGGFSLDAKHTALRVDDYLNVTPGSDLESDSRDLNTQENVTFSNSTGSGQIVHESDAWGNSFSLTTPYSSFESDGQGTSAFDSAHLLLGPGVEEMTQDSSAASSGSWSSANALDGTFSYGSSQNDQAGAYDQLVVGSSSFGSSWSLADYATQSTAVDPTGLTFNASKGLTCDASMWTNQPGASVSTSVHLQITATLEEHEGVAASPGGTRG